MLWYDDKLQAFRTDLFADLANVNGQQRQRQNAWYENYDDDEEMRLFLGK